MTKPASFMRSLKTSPGERQVHAILENLCEQGSGTSDDKNLRALAELASLRTGTRRAVISLRDQEFHHVLADISLAPATTAQSLHSQRYRVDRRGCLYDHGLCAQEEDAPNHLLSVVDCSRDPRFAEHILVKGEDGVRFLTAVPMISATGHQIGVLAVIDQLPRHPLDQNELDGLRDCAACVVRHLELVKSSVNCSRKSSLLRAITSSIEHQYPSLRTCEGDESGHWDKKVSENGSTTGSPDVADSHESENLPDSGVLSSQSSSDSHDALSSAFEDTAQKLSACLHAEELAVYSDPGILGVAEHGIDHCYLVNNGDEKQSDERSSELLYSSIRTGEATRLVRNTSVSFLRHMAASYPYGTALQFLAGAGGEERHSVDGANVINVLGDGSEASASGRLSDETIAERLLPNEALSHVRNLVFLPVRHPHKFDLLAAFILLNVSLPNNLDFTDLRATTNCLSQQIAQVLLQKGEADFLSNFSHELRSPIHGVMGAAQFLQDTTSSSYQTGLLESIFSCSTTLLDTLNLVLDHSKLRAASQPQRIYDISRESSIQLGPPKISAFSCEPTDLAVLVEEATESVVSGHFFDNVRRTTDPRDGRDQSKDLLGVRKNSLPRTCHDVKVILSLAMQDNWAAEVPTGAIRRIVMNLLGNSLKFTPHGSIMISMKLDPECKSGEGMVGFRIQVKDTGIGMSPEFQRDSLFTPFHQENRFESGVGLGLSIVRRLVEALGGTITVTSKVREGTCVDIGLSLRALSFPHSGTPEDLVRIAEKVEGKHLVIIDPQCLEPDYEIAESVRQREDALRAVASQWLKMRVSKTSNFNVQDADFYLFNEPPPAQALLDLHRETPNTQLSSGEIPLIVVATGSKEAHLIETYHARKLEDAGRIVEVLAQPCGPRKLAKILQLCMDRQQQSMRSRTPAGEEPPSTVPPSLADDPGKPSDAKQSPLVVDGKEGRFEGDFSSRLHPTLSLPSHPKREVRSDSKPTASEEPPQKSPQDNKSVQSGLCGLLVDDNRVNLRLLVTLMKKSQYTFAEAEDGQQALDIFKTGNDGGDESARPFDFVLMDIGMPVMNGIESAKRIRQHEREHNLRPTQIIALTAWTDAGTREEAMAAGMDQFLPKPVKFAQLRKLLDELRRPPSERSVGD